MEAVMPAILISNRSGFTLIEVLVAMVITLVGLLGLLQSINIAMEHNVRNHLREEATKVGERVMNDFRSLPFDRLTATNSHMTVLSKMQGFSKSFDVSHTATGVGGSTDSRELEVIVTWSYRNTPTQHRVKSIRSL
jgi:type IV pilus assembly protein PilV